MSLFLQPGEDCFDAEKALSYVFLGVFRVLKVDFLYLATCSEGIFYGHLQYLYYLFEIVLEAISTLLLMSYG